MDWINLDHDSIMYHLRQYGKPYRSTIAFSEFFKSELNESTSVLDVAGGAGAVSAYLAECNPKKSFTVLDISQDLVDIGRKKIEDLKIKNVNFICSDGAKCNLGNTKFDTVICLQTLSWLAGYEEIMNPILREIQPRKIGVTSLFHVGDISAQIKIKEHKLDRQSSYNVYSISEFDRYLRDNGYMVERVEPFKIDIDLPKPNDVNSMGTYTVRTAGDNQRIQISGPLMLPWYMISISKTI